MFRHEDVIKLRLSRDVVESLFLRICCGYSPRGTLALMVDNICADVAPDCPAQSCWDEAGQGDLGGVAGQLLGCEIGDEVGGRPPRAGAALAAFLADLRGERQWMPPTTSDVVAVAEILDTIAAIATPRT